MEPSGMRAFSVWLCREDDDGKVMAIYETRLFARSLEQALSAICSRIRANNLAGITVTEGTHRTVRVGETVSFAHTTVGLVEDRLVDPS